MQLPFWSNITIKGKLLLILFVSVVVLTVLVNLVVYLNYISGESLQFNDLANRIEARILQERFLFMEYLLHGEDRPRDQWLATNQEIGALIQEGKTTIPGQGEEFGRIEQLLSLIREDFVHLVELREDPEAERLGPQEGLVISELLVEEQESATLLNQIATEARANAAQLEQNMVFTVLAMVILLLLLVILLVLVLWRSFMGPLLQLKRATILLKERKFSYRIPLRNPRDEIEQVEETFNEMAGELEKYYNELESIIEQKEDLNRKSRELDEQKTRLINMISHELKNPLAALLVQMEILKRTNGSRREIAGEMEQQLQNLNDVVNDLLSIVKLQREEEFLSFESFDLPSVVQEAVLSANVANTSHKIEVRGVVQRQVYGDRRRIRQVVENLLNNAIKYSEPSSRVLVLLEEREEGAAVCVQDFGIGIPAEEKQRIFEYFFRGQKTMQGVPGMGIGLYFVSEVVKRHGGELSVESEERKGSTFCFTVPFMK